MHRRRAEEHPRAICWEQITRRLSMVIHGTRAAFCSLPVRRPTSLSGRVDGVVDDRVQSIRMNSRM